MKIKERLIRIVNLGFVSEGRVVKVRQIKDFELSESGFETEIEIRKVMVDCGNGKKVEKTDRRGKLATGDQVVVGNLFLMLKKN